MHNKRRKSNALWRLLGLLKGKRLQYTASLLGVSALTTAERMFIAFVLKIWADAVTSGDMTHLRTSLLYWIASYFIFIVCGAYLLYTWRATVQRVTADIREQVFRHAQRLPLSTFEARHSGDVLSVLTNDIATAEQVYQQHVYTLVESAMQGISAVVFMLILDWKLALLIIGCGLVPLINDALFASPLRRAGQEVQAKRGGLSERMSDLVTGFQVVRAFSLMAWIADRFAEANHDVLYSSLKRVKLDVARTAANSTGNLIGLFPYFGGVYMVLKGQTTFGLLIGVVQLDNQVGYFMRALGDTISNIQGGLAAADRILALLDTPPEPEHYAPQPLLTSTKQRDRALVTVRDVHFGYNGGQAVLKGLSLDVHEGQVAALVGPSGGGKSTVLKLLLGCYPVLKGEIYVAHQALNGYQLAALRKQFAYVPQDAYLYSASIMDNIRYGRPGASDAEVMAAAQAAHAHEFVMELPSGYETTVGERGNSLSGGQRQRIAIARALLKDAPILLLDEATSALDSESEQLVQAALEGLMVGRTTIAIAHRLSTIRDADVIYVIDDGAVVEQGVHDDLVNGGGMYRQLYELGFGEATLS